MNEMSVPIQQGPGRLILGISLWIAQVLVFCAFVTFGMMKIFMSISQLAARWEWPADVPEWFVRMMGVVDTAGGLGILLPGLTRIQPRLGVLAAFGCIAVQMSALSFHLMRGEVRPIPLNIILLSLCIFIAWGRSRKVVIEPRSFT